MNVFTYDRDNRQNLETAWDYARIKLGDYVQLRNELHLIDMPFSEPYQQHFALLLAQAYAHEPWPEVALRWDEVLKCAKSEGTSHYVNAIHNHSESNGTMPLVYTQTFSDWISFYARAFNHNVIAFDSFADKPFAAHRAAHLVAAQKWLQMHHKGSFYHDILNGDLTLPYEAYTRGARLFKVAEACPRYSLILAMTCIYPEVSANMRTGHLPPEREETQFCMSREAFSKPIRNWLASNQPQALTWLEHLEERVLLCGSLDTQASVSVPLLTTTYSPVHSDDSPDPFLIARSLFQESGFYGGSAVSNIVTPLPQNLDFNV